jgi:hypothetical protein
VTRRDVDNTTPEGEVGDLASESGDLGVNRDTEVSQIRLDGEGSSVGDTPTDIEVAHSPLDDEPVTAGEVDAEDMQEEGVLASSPETTGTSDVPDAPEVVVEPEGAVTATLARGAGARRRSRTPKERLAQLVDALAVLAVLVGAYQLLVVVVGVALGDPLGAETGIILLAAIVGILWLVGRLMRFLARQDKLRHKDRSQDDDVEFFQGLAAMARAERAAGGDLSDLTPESLDGSAGEIDVLDAEWFDEEGFFEEDEPVEKIQADFIDGLHAQIESLQIERDNLLADKSRLEEKIQDLNHEVRGGEAKLRAAEKETSDQVDKARADERGRVVLAVRSLRANDSRLVGETAGLRSPEIAPAVENTYDRVVAAISRLGRAHTPSARDVPVLPSLSTEVTRESVELPPLIPVGDKESPGLVWELPEPVQEPSAGDDSSSEVQPIRSAPRPKPKMPPWWRRPL